MDSNPLHFTCSRCGARPYDPCKDTKSRQCKPHKERARIYGRRAPDPTPDDPVFPPDNVSESPNHKPESIDKGDSGG